jgi:hypothetical protein
MKTVKKNVRPMGCGSSGHSIGDSDSDAPVVPVPRRQPPAGLFGTVEGLMKSRGWKFAVDRENSVMYAVIGHTSLTLFLRIHVDENRQAIQTRITLEQNCPESARRKLAVWCNARNWQLKWGFFFCNPDDGEITFRDAMAVRHITVTGKMVDNLLKRVNSTVVKAYDEIIQIVQSGR